MAVVLSSEGLGGQLLKLLQPDASASEEMKIRFTPEVPAKVALVDVARLFTAEQDLHYCQQVIRKVLNNNKELKERLTQFHFSGLGQKPLWVRTRIRGPHEFIRTATLASNSVLGEIS